MVESAKCSQKQNSNETSIIIDVVKRRYAEMVNIDINSHNTHQKDITSLTS